MGQKIAKKSPKWQKTPIGPGAMQRSRAKRSHTATKILREVELNHVILRNFRNVLRRKLWVKLIGFRPVEYYGNFTFPYQSMIILNGQLVNSFNFFNISTAVSVKQLCLQEFVKIFVSDFQNLLIITTLVSLIIVQDGINVQVLNSNVYLHVF